MRSSQADFCNDHAFFLLVSKRSDFLSIFYKMFPELESMRGQGAASCTCVPLSELVRPEGDEDGLIDFIGALSTNELRLDGVLVKARLMVSWLARDFLCDWRQLCLVLSMFSKVFLHFFLKLNVWVVCATESSLSCLLALL